MTLPSHEIAVRLYHNILIWPVLLRGTPSRTDSADAAELEGWVRAFEKESWKSTPSRADYEDVVYFHPFVRDFLFGDGTTREQQRSLRLLTRRDVDKVRVVLGKWSAGKTLTLQVERTHLYLLKPRTAALVVEVSNQHHDPEHPDGPRIEEPLTLETALNFQDQFRRIFPPFWWDREAAGDSASEPGLCPLSVVWLPRNVTAATTAGGFSTGSPRRAFAAFTAAGAEAPVFDHWQFCFGRVRPVQTRGDALDRVTTRDDAGNPRLF